MTPAEKRNTLVSALAHYSSRWAAGERMSRVEAEEWIAEVEADRAAEAVTRLQTLLVHTLIHQEGLLRNEIKAVLDLLPSKTVAMPMPRVALDRATDLIAEALGVSGDHRVWCRALAQQILNDAGRYAPTEGSPQ